MHYVLFSACMYCITGRVCCQQIFKVFIYVKSTRITEVINKIMNALQNKYTKWYYELIETRRHNVKTNYTECHHIVPRSLGGSDNADNLVHLTYREHFIAHLLLSKMFTGVSKIKMSFAARQMLGTYCPNSKIYEIVKRNANTASKELWTDVEWASKIIAERKNRLADPEVRSKMSEIMLDVWQRPEYKEKHKASMQQIQTEELSNQKSEKMKAVWKDPDKRNALLSNRKPHTEERKSKQSKITSQNNKASWSDPVVRAKRIEGIKAAKAKNKAAKAALFTHTAETN